MQKGCLCAREWKDPVKNERPGANCGIPFHTVSSSLFYMRKCQGLGAEAEENALEARSLTSKEKAKTGIPPETEGSLPPFHYIQAISLLISASHNQGGSAVLSKLTEPY